MRTICRIYLLLHVDVRLVGQARKSFVKKTLVAEIDNSEEESSVDCGFEQAEVLNSDYGISSRSGKFPNFFFWGHVRLVSAACWKALFLRPGEDIWKNCSWIPIRMTTLVKVSVEIG